MSSGPQSLEQRTKIKLVKLVNALQPIINTQIADFEDDEITNVLNNFRQFLALDLVRDFEKRKEKNLKESPFDAIINDIL